MHTPDIIRLRRQIFESIDFSDVDTLLDLGCGNGYDLFEMDRITEGKIRRLIGMDARDVRGILIEHPQDSRFEWMAQNLEKGIDLPDRSVDLIYSMNFLECIPNVNQLVSEMARILTDNGKIAIAHFDWDAMVINGRNKSIIRKMVHSFAEWKQDWMNHSDGWIGRRLWGIFESLGRFQGEVRIFPLINTEYADTYHGKRTVDSFYDMIGKGIVTEEEYAEFRSDMTDTINRGEYFFSIPMMVYLGKKKSFNPSDVSQ